MKLAIIGTAGRGPDGEKLKGMWRSMKNIAICATTFTMAKKLVSGGAAYSDHLCVQLYLEGYVDELTLHLPAEFTSFGFRETGSKFDAGKTSNYYHDLFSKANNFNSLEEINKAIEKGAKVTVGQGFKDRNTQIALDADLMLAFTFGNGSKLADGGTFDTMTKFLKKKAQLDQRIKENDLNGVIHGPNHYRAFHFCLNERKLFEI